MLCLSLLPTENKLYKTWRDGVAATAQEKEELCQRSWCDPADPYCPGQPACLREKYQWYIFTLVSLGGIQPWGPQLDVKACYVGLTGKAIHVDEPPDFWLPQGEFLGHNTCKRPPRTVPEDTVVVVPLLPTHRGQKVKTGHGFPGCFVSTNCCDSWR